MKTGFLTLKQCENNDNTDANYTRVGKNTGNIVFSEAIKKIFRCETFTHDELKGGDKGDQYDNFITADFIWIRENEDKSSYRYVLDAIKHKPLTPISIGLQSSNFNPDFKLHAGTVNIFKEMQEKSTLGVRGNYTADILNKHGIKNIEVIGCPSLYYNMDPEFKIHKKDFSAVYNILCNYQTLTKELTYRDFQVLKYLNNYCSAFIEQVVNYMPGEMYKIIPHEVTWLITKKKQIFFMLESWLNFMKNYDFSIGARFHGNVVALLTGIPCLFLTIDSRTKELTDYFNLPSMNVEEFNTVKPLRYYYEEADYTEFNKNYKNVYKKFIDFSKKNNLIINK